MNEAANPVLDALLGRRSIGRVSPEALPRELIGELIGAALRAPNHGLTHPWRFIVVTGSARRAIGEAHAAAAAREQGGLTRQAHAKESGRLERAPAVIVCLCSSSTADPTVRRENRDAVAAGIQNLLLAAAARGLGAIWRTGSMADEPEARAALGLSADEDIVGFVYVGRPVGNAPRTLTRRPTVDQVTEWRDEVGR